MFSWSSAANNQHRSTPNPGYPGARSSTASPVVVAQPISGTIRPPDYTRAQHIESYLNDDTLKRSTRRVSADDSTYDTVFQTTTGDTLILRVHLPVTPILNNSSTTTRTARTPAMTLAGVKARHPWLDARMRITGYAPIQSDDAWKSSRHLLGTAVHEVVKHLQVRPPDVLEITDAGLKSIQNKTQTNGSRHASSTSNNSASVVNRSSARNSQHSTIMDSNDAPPEYSAAILDMPEIPRQFDELDALPREDLDALLEDELEFTTFINKLPIFKAIQSTADDILEENVVAAKANLEKEEQVKALHKDVVELQQSLEKELKRFQTLEREQDALCAPPDLRDVLRKLNRAKKEAFVESEQYAEEWVEDGSNVEAFVRDFVEKRMVQHIRAAKIERLQVQPATNQRKTV